MITENLSVSLSRVNPTKTLFFTSMPCERSAALSRRQMVDALAGGDVATILCQYLENKAFLYRIRIALGIDVIVFLGCTAINWKTALFGVCVLLDFACTLRNHTLYHETVSVIEPYLCRHFTSIEWDEIKTLGISSARDLNALKTILARNHLDTSFIDSQLMGLGEEIDYELLRSVF